jgi:hypothetical protein
MDYAADGGVRTFSLLALHREGNEHLFLKIEDEDRGLCYAVHELGGSVRLYPPVLKTDAAGHVNILHQSGPAQLTHSVFDADGRVQERTVYRLSGGQPELRSRPDGFFEVVGGTPYPEMTAPAMPHQSGPPDTGHAP